MSDTPLFSILHTSARPDKWRAVYDDWMSKAVHPENVEYVLCIDPKWGFSTDTADYDMRYEIESEDGNSVYIDNLVVVLQNPKRSCYVEGVNIAARASTGAILIVNADDQFACEGWDEKLEVRYRSYSAFGCLNEFVLEVDCGGHEHDRQIMPMPILSRARYEKVGYVFYPEYESMWADNDFFAHAYQDGVVIDARHLLFPHLHPMYESDWAGVTVDDRWDEAYQMQNRSEAAILGKRIFERRKASGFPPMQHGVERRTIALCLSGERFEGPWVDHVLSLYGHLKDLDFAIMRVHPSSRTNVYLTREAIRRAVMDSPLQPELCLWIDDDNPLSVEHFDRLLTGLDAHPEVDGIAGWCWIHDEAKTRFTPSCGMWAPDHLHWQPFPPEFANEEGLRPFESGGLPCILMRLSALVKAGSGAFLPVIDSRLDPGMLGEDGSFFLHAEQGGAKFLADPQVRVPHLKYVSVEPVFPSEGKVPVKVACMIRAKNEARWIARTIESVKALCDCEIYVMEDGSTDDTFDIAVFAGARARKSPFAGQGFNEVRDKDWLLDHVTRDCNPDWIIMLDGDEELQPGGCDIIRRVLESNPPVDCYALRVLNLWDSVEEIRVDGAYSNFRQSLFRAKSGLTFKSYYEGTGKNHCGLHCSNAPGLGGMRLASLNVALLHYGALHREDRIRKYKWITQLDPGNEAEGEYLHMVQGDLGMVPADEKLKHGGPLKLEQLPAWLVPKFDNGVPGPLQLAEGVSV